MKNLGIVGNTVLDTREGYRKIEDLVGFDNQWILFHNFNNDTNTYRKVDNIWMDGKGDIIEIELNEGNKFKIAVDNKLYLKNNELVELISAKNIKKGDMIFGSKYYYKVKEVCSRIKEIVFNLGIPNIHNFLIFDEKYLEDFTGILIKCN